MSEDEQFELLASDGMLVKRPILIDVSSNNNLVLVGFRQPEWEEKLLKIEDLIASGLEAEPV